jgi:hypothetical protein
MAYFPAFAETGASQSRTSTTSANADDSLDEVIVTAEPLNVTRAEDIAKLALGIAATYAPMNERPIDASKYWGVAGIEKAFEYNSLSYSLIVEDLSYVSVEEAFDD